MNTARARDWTIKLLPVTPCPRSAFMMFTSVNQIPTNNDTSCRATTIIASLQLLLSSKHQSVAYDIGYEKECHSDNIAIFVQETHLLALPSLQLDRTSSTDFSMGLHCSWIFCFANSQMVRTAATGFLRWIGNLGVSSECSVADPARPTVPQNDILPSVPRLK